MGCDIHLVVEVRHRYQSNGKTMEYWSRRAPPPAFRCPWHNREDRTYTDPYDAVASVLCWYCDRSYDTFAILANVRNGYGFAGCDTGDGFVPISEPRGYPPDMDESATVPWTEGRGGPGPGCGDHSFSWLSLAEMLAYDWTQGTTKRGVISLPDFAKREAAGGAGAPETWCGEISGPGIVTLGEHEARTRIRAAGIAQPIAERDRVYVRVSWGTDYATAAGDFYRRVIPGLQTLAPDPADVRIVFGFDS